MPANGSTVHNDGSHADKRPIPDGASMNNGAVTDGDVITDGNGITAFTGMDHDEILNVRSVSDCYGTTVSADDGVMPYGTIISEGDVAFDYGIFSCSDFCHIHILKQNDECGLV